jgi:branched-chain amino acid transport system substrate-binding protein
MLAIAGAGPTYGREQTSVRVGYAISMTGPNAPGAAITLLPNYRMWVREVNAEGGIMLKSLGKRLPIEVIEYDDQSSSDGLARGMERLIAQDQVDFILAPWGTGLNIAAGPILHEAGYPHLAVTAATDRAPEFVKKWPNSFWLLGSMSEGAQALVQVLSKVRSEGKIGANVAMMNVADQFGIELSGAVRRAVKKAKFDLVYDRAYPVGMDDMRPMLSEIMQASPDVFLAVSYPPDTKRLTEQSRALGFNPKVFYTAVGTAYPTFKDTFGADAEGVMGSGGWDADSPASRRYLERHVAETGHEPDRWASPVAYASLQMLQQAIERVGSVDRTAVIRELHTGSFETVLGPVKLENNIRMGGWWLGQWQNGEFYGIAPIGLEGARPPVVPKPAWHGE